MKTKKLLTEDNSRIITARLSMSDFKKLMSIAKELGVKRGIGKAVRHAINAYLTNKGEGKNVKKTRKNIRDK